MSGGVQDPQEALLRNSRNLALLESVGFDYAAIDQALGESSLVEQAKIDREVLEGFRAVLGLLIDATIPPQGRTPDPRAIGLRFIALLQLVRPEAFRGKSLNEISREVGVSRAALSKLLVAYSDAFGFCARHQPSLKARRTFADVQRVIRDRRRRLRQQLASENSGDETQLAIAQ